MTGIEDLAKFWNIKTDINAPAIYFFHAYNRLIKQSREENGLDPYPVKYIGNLDSLTKALAKLIGSMFKALRGKS